MKGQRKAINTSHLQFNNWVVRNYTAAWVHTSVYVVWLAIPSKYGVGKSRWSIKPDYNGIYVPETLTGGRVGYDRLHEETLDKMK